MSDIKRALEKKYTELYGFEPYENNLKRIRNALSIICQGKYSGGDIIDIDDDSFSGNGKSGMVLTVEAVCIKQTFDKIIAKYADITDIRITSERFLGDLQYTLELKMIYGTTYKYISNRIDERVVEFINYARSLYEEDDDLVW